MKTVSIYTTNTCSYCKMAKDYFQKHNIPYSEFNVGEDLAKREEMISLSGQMGVPVIKIDDDLVVGFDKRRLETLLGLTQPAV